MAAQETAIANIYEPAIWSKYFVEQNTAKSLLVQSGIAGTDADIESAAGQGGKTVTMPFWNDLPFDEGTYTRSVPVTDTDDDLTPTGVSAGEEKAVKLFRAKAWRMSPVVKYIAGSDPAAMVMDRYVGWWKREEQRLLLKILAGVFSDSTIATALSLDISGSGATSDASKLIGSDSITNARFLLGDAFDKFTAMIMHSTCFKRLCNLDLIDNVPDSQQSLLKGRYMGLDVLVDDDMTNTAATTHKYSTFLFGRGAIARQDIPFQGGELGDSAIELLREPLKGMGAGRLSIITRRFFLLHPRGVTYDASVASETGPTDAELAADSWGQAWQTKNIRIARLITNG